MDKNRKTMILAIVAVISFIVITVGTTVAFFNYAKTGSTENTLETGSISFIYEEVNRIGNGISIEDALPTSDSEGKAQTNYFDFKVTSSTASTIAIPYEITTRIVDGSDDLTDYVKLYLTKVNGTSEEEKVLSIYSDLDDSTNSLASKYNDKTLYEDEIPVDVSNFVENYRLRMWIDDSVDFSDESFNNKTFSIKVNVYANGEQASEQKIASASTTDISGIKINGVTATENTDSSLNYDYYVETELDDNNDIELIALNDGQTYTVENITEQEANALKQVVSKQDLNLVLGDNYLKVTVTSANRKNVKNYVLCINVLSNSNEWTFDYSGSSEEWIVPYDGQYKLEVWGASGGYASSEDYPGGRGGYSVGYMSFEKNNSIYITIGGAGGNATSKTNNYTGGYNGGGNANHYGGNNTYASSGGGATHIALDSGVLSSLSAHATDGRILLVAGGGGGSFVGTNDSSIALGGAGGGSMGIDGQVRSDGTARNGLGGTQLAGGSYGGTTRNVPQPGTFGQGGNSSATATATTSSNGGGGASGGGGYYGGGGGTMSSAGGGSGYIGGVTNGQTIAGNSEIPSPTGETEIGHSGNGYAKITYLGQ